MPKRFRFLAADGTEHTWSRAELDDTLLEGDVWDTAATRKRIDALKVGQSITRRGDKLTRIGKDGARKPNPSPPSLAQLGTMSEHGRVVDLVVENLRDGEHEIHTFPSRPPLLCWSQKKRALVFVSGVKLPRSKQGAPRDDGAAATYERFHGEDVSSHRDWNLPAVQLKSLGRAVTIGYRGKKWSGKVAEHPFGPSVRAYVGARGSKHVFVLTGGRLRMTAGGIEG